MIDKERRTEYVKFENMDKFVIPRDNLNYVEINIKYSLPCSKYTVDRKSLPSFISPYMCCVYYLSQDMLLNVFREFIIISLIRYITGDLIHATGNEMKWKEASQKCGTQFVGSNLFGNCQPETCNASLAANRIQKLGIGRQQFWINGYVLRSPVMVYKGCYSVIQDVDNFYEEQNTFSDNSPYICSRECTTMESGDLIFLSEVECLCIRKNRFIALSSMKSCVQVSNLRCDTVCHGHKSDICGGKKKNNTNVTYFSAYEIIQRDIDKIPFRDNIGKACTAITWDVTNNPVQSFQFCRKNLKYICEHYNATAMVYGKAVCNTSTVSWSSARNQCQSDGQQLLSSDNNKCLANGDQYWHGRYSEETIFWKSDTLPRDARCLLLVVDGTHYSFAVERCNKTMYALCSKQQVPDVATTTPFDTFETTSPIATNLTKESNRDGHDTSTIVPIVAGVVGGVIVLAIIIAVLLIRNRRRRPKSKSQRTTKENRTDYYSEPSITRYPPEEQKKLVSTTEEGVYNHLGDEENLVKLSPTGAIYDIMRNTENDYDVSQTSRNQQQEEQMNDLYDESRDIDRGLYDTTNEKTSNDRPESDAYNAISVT